MEIRTAALRDAEELLGIYAPYVTGTAISFECEVPSVEEFRERIRRITAEYPYLAAVEDGRIAGYAYATLFRSREAYRHSVETTIYLREGMYGRGIGRALYTRLEELLAAQGVYRAYACITVPDSRGGDPGGGSEAFHRRMGYRLTGRHDLCGWKNGNWYSVIWMEKVLREAEGEPVPFVPFGGGA